MCATYVLNRCPTKALQSITPYEAWHGKKPFVSHLRVFGCLAYALVPQQHRRKLDDKVVKCIFVGYSAESKGYRLYHPQSKHRSWLVEMLYLWKILCSLCFHVPKRQVYAHRTCMILYCLCLLVDALM